VAFLSSVLRAIMAGRRASRAATDLMTRMATNAEKGRQEDDDDDDDEGKLTTRACRAPPQKWRPISGVRMGKMKQK